MTPYTDEAKPPTLSLGVLIRFLAFLPVSIVGTLLAYPLVPLAVALADELGRLPRPLRWLETHDAPGWLGPATEEATRKTAARFGNRVALIHWLWRNKAYRLRHWMRARIEPDMPTRQAGVVIPARWGFSYWLGQVGPYFEWQPRIGCGSFHLYLRVGWKLKPVFAGIWPDPASPVGMYTGITPRMDDWDDFPEELRRDDLRGPAALVPVAIALGLALWGALLLWLW